MIQPHPGRCYSFDAYNPTAQYKDMNWQHQKRNELNETPAEDLCSFCRKSSSNNLRIFASPNGVHICSKCFDICEEILRDYEVHPPATKSGAPISDHRMPRCSFCLRSKDEVRYLIAGPIVYICGDCAVQLRESLGSI
jgi:hypothetical protein